MEQAATNFVPCSYMLKYIATVASYALMFRTFSLSKVILGNNRQLVMMYDFLRDFLEGSNKIHKDYIQLMQY